ncbi:hypothetical protein Cgig2_013318 [Carnegiea gigantea]|uniref:Uncharacterized protein n=1 Tax=Carnegiea gigantea TaxID=171969 RepID=A0A9Q1GHN9_9CARY|nr:hypothetical protein Cgig2_013318 [Carnegiea gigantea]
MSSSKPQLKTAKDLERHLVDNKVTTIVVIVLQNFLLNLRLVNLVEEEMSKLKNGNERTEPEPANSDGGISSTGEGGATSLYGWHPNAEAFMGPSVAKKGDRDGLNGERRPTPELDSSRWLRWVSGMSPPTRGGGSTTASKREARPARGSAQCCLREREREREKERGREGLLQRETGNPLPNFFF